MDPEAAVRALPESLRDPFRRLIREGELSPELEAAIGQDPVVQRVVDEVLEADARAFQELDEKRRPSSRTLPPSSPSSGRSASHRRIQLSWLWYALFLLLGVLTDLGFHQGFVPGLLALAASLAAGVLFVRQQG